MKVGDLVEVETKFHGKKIGTIIEQWAQHRRRVSWIVHIPNHWTSSTIAEECDLKVIS
jgi:hypothetical protein